MQPVFPLEFVVSGTPVSLGSSAQSRERWSRAVRAASDAQLPESHWLTDGPISVTLFYFPADPMAGDIDNIIKPILDAFTLHIYFDDHQVERIVAQKFEPDRYFAFASPSAMLAEAIAGDKPKLYIRISTDPFEELR